MELKKQVKVIMVMHIYIIYIFIFIILYNKIIVTRDNNNDRCVRPGSREVFCEVKTVREERDRAEGVKDLKTSHFLPYRLLEATKNETVVRSQDLFTVVRYVSYNELGQDMAWDWTTLNWDYLVKRSVLIWTNI